MMKRNDLSFKMKMLIILPVAVLALAASCPGQSPEPTGAQSFSSSIALEDTLTRYELYSRIYYRIKSMELSNELITHEKYLTFLLRSVNTQLSGRGDITRLDVETKSPLELNKIALEDAESRKDNIFARKFQIWRDFQLNEIYLKTDKALRIKRRIYEKSSPSEQRRMFNNDLEVVYNVLFGAETENYELALKILNHIQDFYDYEEMDDIHYLMAEAYYGDKQYRSSIDDFKRVLIDSPTRWPDRR